MNRTVRGLFFTAIAALVVAVLPARAQANDSDEMSVQRTFSVSDGSTLRVENYKGKIAIRGGSTNQIAVHALKHFEGSDDDRKWWLENLKIDINQNGTQTFVKVTYPNRECVFCDTKYVAWVELEIAVPAKTNLDVDGYKPVIDVSRVDGDINIKSYKAMIHLLETAGGISIDTYKETVKLEDVTVRGRLRVKSYKADVTVEAKSLGEDASIENEKGSIVVRLPENAGVDLAFSGGRRASFRSDFPITTNGSYGSSRSIEAKINNGGTPLRLRTDRGRVAVEKWRAEI
jgi:putative adhesin